MVVQWGKMMILDKWTCVPLFLDKPGCLAQVIYQQDTYKQLLNGVHLFCILYLVLATTRDFANVISQLEQTYATFNTMFGMQTASL